MAKNLFLENYNYIQSKFYSKFNSDIKTYSFNQKILDNPSNLDILINVLENEEGDILIIAPTGSGKTFSMHYANEKISNKEKNSLMLVPAHIQARQCEAQYDAYAYYGESGKVKVIEKSGNITYKKGQEISKKEKSSLMSFAVYDSFETAHKTEYFRNLIMDEAQLLQDAIDYRGEAIKKIEELSKKYKNRVYITATPNILMYKHFDVVINFEGEKNYFYNNIKLIKTNDSVLKSLKKLTLDKLNNNEIPFIRENSRARINELKTFFEKKGFRVGFITSSEKGFALVEEDGSIVYDNSFTNSVINNEELDTLNYDLFICSCVLDQGINITNTNSDKDISKVCMIYDCFDINQFKIDTFQQFFARVRADYNEAIIITKNKTNEYGLNFKDLVCKEMNILNRRIDYINDTKEYFNLKSDVDKEEFLSQLEFKNIEGRKNNNCLVIDDNFNISIDYKKFFNYIYNKFNNDLYYNLSKLSEYFDNLIIEEMDEVEDDFNKITKNDKETILDIVEIFENKNTTGEEKKKYEKEVLSNLSIKTIDKYEYFKLFGLSEQESASIVSSKNKDIETTEDLLFSDFIQKLDSKTVKFIQKDIKNNIDSKEALILKGNKNYKKIAKNIEFIKEFQKSGATSFDGFLKTRQYVMINKMYKNNEINKIVGTSGKEQLAIINMKLTNRNISFDLIEEVIKELNSKLGYNLNIDKDEEKVQDLISYIYNIDSNNKIRDLRTKF